MAVGWGGWTDFTVLSSGFEGFSSFSADAGVGAGAGAGVSVGVSCGALMSFTTPSSASIVVARAGVEATCGDLMVGVSWVAF